ncbi:hypothetical protein QBC41DRAFT_301510 [Cercophora samala]|uniref:Ubiquitin 3 binding protein But2 C-terminal domain-containing protein n=1 Tax=Cercophora samala TaxID=330535 RepID=A0AA39ZGB7_9PEZI|nr:hypothetical protein QBC41DRAFT_301510 [Cercophora samala]
MQFSTLFITLSAAAGLALAAPTSQTGQSTCQRVSPSSNVVHITTRPNDVEPQILTFNVPADARGTCTLIVDIPAGYPIQDSGVQAGHSPLPVDVIDFHSDNNGPRSGPLLYTLRIPSALPDKKTTKAVKLAISSFPCENSQGNIKLFRLQVAAPGEVSFELNDQSGLFVEYGC